MSLDETEDSSRKNDSMSGELIHGRSCGIVLPAIIAEEGEQAGRRFIEFFVATIRNKNTRETYAQAVSQFFRWCEERRITRLQNIEPIVVAAYVEQMTEMWEASTAKVHLAAIKMLFDWLVTGQIIPVNPALSVKGPKLVVTTGKTPYLSIEDAAHLLKSIETSNIVGLRDRALIAVMTYAVGRVSAVLGMTVDDYYANGKRWRVRLHEKGGKFLENPAHHKLEEYLDAYIEAAGISGDRKGPLFRSAKGHAKKLSDKPLGRKNAWEMVKRRAAAAGLTHKLCNHSFRATGLTAYMKGGGDIDTAKRMAGHACTKTTGLYIRTKDEITLDEVERIAI